MLFNLPYFPGFHQVHSQSALRACSSSSLSTLANVEICGSLPNSFKQTQAVGQIEDQRVVSGGKLFFNPPVAQYTRPLQSSMKAWRSSSRAPDVVATTAKLLAFSCGFLPRIPKTSDVRNVCRLVFWCSLCLQFLIA